MSFIFTSLGPIPSYANELYLPKPGVMVHLSPPMNPPLLKGIKVYTNNPFKFDFVLDQGDSTPAEALAKAGSSNQEQLKTEAQRLIKYFLASITVPEEDLWVNLSPYEKDRIIPDAFGKSEMGRDLLAQDYLLKQITASLIYPEEQIGKAFWQKVYAEAQKKFGTTNIPVNTFNKVWIVPAKAVVYENTVMLSPNANALSSPNASVGDLNKNNQSVAYIVESRLKVMLEQDYLSLSHSERSEESKSTNSIGSQIVRDIVLPELEKEVNEGKNFAPLRQVYHSLILAAWYKQKIKKSILAQIYADKRKVTGVGYEKSVILSPEGTKDLNRLKDSSPTPQNDDVNAIYRQYLKAFKKGVFNYIKEEPSVILSEAKDPNATTILRKYFSGGVVMAMTSPAMNGSTRLSSSVMTIIKNPAMLPVDQKANQSVFIGMEIHVADASKKGGMSEIKLPAKKSFIRSPSKSQKLKDQQAMNLFRGIQQVFQLNRRYFYQSQDIESLVSSIHDQGDEVIPYLIANLSSDTKLKELSAFESGSELSGVAVYQYILVKALKKFGLSAVAALSGAIKKERMYKDISLELLAEIDAVEAAKVLEKISYLNAKAIRLAGQLNVTALIPKLRKKLRQKFWHGDSFAAVDALSRMNDESSMREIVECFKFFDSEGGIINEENKIKILNEIQKTHRLFYKDFVMITAQAPLLKNAFGEPDMSVKVAAITALAFYDVQVFIKAVDELVKDHKITSKGSWQIHKIIERLVDEHNVEAVAGLLFSLLGKSRPIENEVIEAMMKLAKTDAIAADYLRKWLYSDQIWQIFLKEGFTEHVEKGLDERMSEISRDDLEGALIALKELGDPRDIKLMRYLSQKGKFSESQQLANLYLIKSGEQDRQYVVELFQQAETKNIKKKDIVPAIFSLPDLDPGIIEAALLELHKYIFISDESEQDRGGERTNYLNLLMRHCDPRYRVQIVQMVLKGLNDPKSNQNLRLEFPDMVRYADLWNEVQALLHPEQRIFTDRFLWLIDKLRPEHQMQCYLVMVRQAQNIKIRLSALTKMYQDIKIISKLDSQLRESILQQMREVTIQITQQDPPTSSDRNTDSFDDLQAAAISALPFFIGTHDISVSILRNQKKYSVNLRKIAKGNVIRRLRQLIGRYDALPKKLSDSDATSEKHLLDEIPQQPSSKKKTWLNRLVNRKEIKEIIQLLNEYKEIKEEDVTLDYEAMSGLLVAEASSERMVEDQPITEVQKGKIVFEIDSIHALTPREPRSQENMLLEAFANKTGKSKKLIQEELDEELTKRHIRMMHLNGFIDPDASPDAPLSQQQSADLHEIFSKLKDGYSKLPGKPRFRGKLFVVDSPEVNAFAYSERDDFFLFMGIVWEVKRYCLIEGIPFSKDIIAAIFAHEMGHVYQNTAFEGIGFSDLKDKQIAMNEMLDLKKKAEYDADRISAKILSESGFNPLGISELLKFLRKTTKNTTAEAAVQTHPHPLERIRSIDTLFMGEGAIPGQGRELQLFVADHWSTVHHRHIGEKAARISSLRKLQTFLAEAQTLEEIIEITKIAQYMQSRSLIMKLSETEMAKSAFARKLYVSSLLDVMKNMVARETQAASAIVPPTLGVASSEGQLLMRLMGQEEARPEESGAYQTLLGQLAESTKLGKDEQGLRDAVNGIRREVRLLQSLSAQKKVEILRVIDAMEQTAIDAMRNNEINHQVYADYISSEPVTEKDLEQLLAALLNRRLNAEELSLLMQSFLKKPYAVYRTYGKTTLNEQMEMKDYLAAVGREMVAGIDLKQMELSKIFLERVDPNFYTPDIRMMPLGTLEQREKFFKSILIPFVSERAVQGYDFDQRRAIEGPYAVQLTESIIQAVARVGKGVFVQLLNQAGNKLVAEDEALFNQWLTQHISRNINPFLGPDQIGMHADKVKLFKKQMEEVFFGEAEAIFSSLFANEYGASATRIASVPLLDLVTRDWQGRREHMNFKIAELNGDVNGVAGFLISQLNFHGGGNIDFSYGSDYRSRFWNEQKEKLYPYLIQLSVHFRTQVIKEIIISQRLYPTVFELQEFLKDLVYLPDAYEILVQFLGDKQADLNDLTQEMREKHLGLMNWLIDNKPEKMNEMPRGFLIAYMNMRLWGVYVQMKADHGASSGKPFSDISVDEKLSLVKKYLNPDLAFDILDRLASAGTLELRQIGKEIVVKEEENLVLGVVGSERNKRVLEGEQYLTTEEIPSKYAPKAFFRVPTDILDQYLFRSLYNLDRNQLQSLAKRQRLIRDKEAMARGRLKQEMPATNAQQLIDQLIFFRAMKEHGFPVPEFSSDDFSSIERFFLEGRHAYRDYWEDGKSISEKYVKWEIKGRTLSSQDAAMVSARWQNELMLNTKDPRVKERLKKMFQSLYEGGMIGQYPEMDNFLESIAKTENGLELFFFYAEWMQEMQIPKPKRETLDPTAQARPYLETLITGVDIEGRKARVFKMYDQKFSKLLKSKAPLKMRLALLLHFLNKATLFRDGFIDQWERSLVPEMDLSTAEEIGLFMLQKGIKDDYSKFQTIGLMTFLQWEKLKTEDLKMPKERAEEILLFYETLLKATGRETKVADPQRQVRMGLTALKIFRTNILKTIPKEQRAQKELEAIQNFMPFACSLRDKELFDYLEKYEVNGNDIPATVLNEVRMLLTDYQGMLYDEELTNASYFEQMMRAVLTGASREDRSEILMWVMDPKANPEPKLLKQIHDKLHITFEKLPQHLKLIPEGERIKVFESLFLGENGLFDPKSPGDEKVMNDLFDKLFLSIFPPIETSAATGWMDQFKGFFKKKRQFDTETYNLIREIFPIVMKAYKSPARKASIMIALLRGYDELSTKTDGQKLAILLSAMGPVGVKLGQVLSQSEDMIPSNALRSDLGSLKSKANVLSKFIILDALQQAGIKMEDVRIGRCLAAASMKQVHDGWFRGADGQWRPVVFKVLRPRIERTVDDDIAVLKDVLTAIKEKRGEYGHIAETVEEMIRIEMDFRNEDQNEKDIQLMVDDFERIHPEDKDEQMPLNVPTPIDQTRPSVMMEGKAPGIEAGKLFEPMGLRSWLRGKGWRTKKSMAEELVEKRGLSLEEASKFINSAFAVDKGKLVKRLRHLFFFMLFEDKEGRFHADMHSDNVMIGPQLSLIDLGLVGRFKEEEQRDGAKNVFKGLLFHDEELIFEGVKAIHVYSSRVSVEEQESLGKAIDSEAVNIKNGLKNIFAKRGTIQNEMNDIQKLVENLRFKGKQDFVYYMKALITAVWIFPTNSPVAAVSTLLDIKNQFKMTWKEVGRIAQVHAWPVFKGSIMSVASNLKEDALGLIRNLSAPLIKEWARLKFAAAGVDTMKSIKKNGSRLFTFAKKAEDIKKEEAKKEQPKYELPKTKMIDVGSIEMEQNKKLNLGDIRIRKEPLAFSAVFNLNAQDQQLFEEALEVYGKVKVFVGHSDVFPWKGKSNHWEPYVPPFGPNLNIEEAGLVGLFVSGGLASLVNGLAEDLIIRDIANRIMRQRFSDQWDKLNGKIPLDLFMPQNPVVRHIVERWADMYLNALDQETYKPDSGPEKNLKDAFLRLDSDLKVNLGLTKSDEWREKDETSSVYGLTLDINGKAVDVDTRNSMREIKILDADYIQPDILGRIKQMKDILTTKEPGVFDFSFIKAIVYRTGFTELGRFMISMVNLKDNEVVKFTLTESEFDQFVLKGQIPTASLEKWEAVPFSSPEDWKQKVSARNWRMDNHLKKKRVEVADSVSEQIGENVEEVKSVSIVTSNAQVATAKADQASITANSDAKDKGGIDLTTGKLPLEVRKGGSPTSAVGGSAFGGKAFGDDGDFNIDPTMLEQLQNAPGFVPVIINVQPLMDLRLFLGVQKDC